MPKNKRNYKVSNAEIFQIIENYHFTVVDARTDLQAKSSKIVKID